MSVPSSVSAAGWREIPPLQALPEPTPRVLRAPLAVRRAVVVPDLEDGVWAESVAAAERAFGRAGTHAGGGDDRRWTAAPTRRQSEVRLSTSGVAGGVRVEIEHVRPRPRPWVAAAVWLCLPAAVVVASVLAGRAASLAEWSVVAGLLAVPAAVAVWVGAVEWARSLTVLRRVRRVLQAAERAAWQSQARWVETHEMPPDDGPFVEPEAEWVDPALGLNPGHWLALDELDGLRDAQPARVAPQDLRRARRTVERATALRRAPIPEGFAEWRPTAPAWRS